MLNQQMKQKREKRWYHKRKPKENRHVSVHGLKFAFSLRWFELLLLEADGKAAQEKRDFFFLETFEQSTQLPSDILQSKSLHLNLIVGKKKRKKKVLKKSICYNHIMYETDTFFVFNETKRFYKF